MDTLDVTLYGNAVSTWITALLIAGGVFAGLRLLNTLVIRHLHALANRSQNELDDLAADVLRQTKLPFLVLVALYAGIHFLTLPSNVAEAVEAVAVIAVLVQAAIWGNVAIGFVLNRHTQRQMAEDAATATTMKFVGFLARLGLWLVIFLMVLDNLGVDITALVAGLGIGGIAVALAVQNVLGDLLASLSIVLDKPFVIGDFIIVDNLMGTVEHVGLKTTRVRSLSGEQLVFSNNDLLNSRIRNYKRMMERRVTFTLGVVYGTPRDKLAAIPGMIREIIEAHEKARFDRAHFKSFGDFSLNYEVVYYVQDPDYNTYMDIQQAINLAVYQRFEEEGIEFAFPTQTLIVEGAPAAVPAGGETA